MSADGDRSAATFLDQGDDAVIMSTARATEGGHGTSTTRSVALGTLAVLVAGALLGVLWWWAAPLARTDVYQGQAFLTGHQELQAAQDGWLAIFLGVFGVLAAALVSLRAMGQDARSAVLGPLAVGLVGLVAWRTGVLLGPPSLVDQVRAGVRHPLTPLELHAFAVLLAGPLMFALTRFLAALFAPTSHPSHARHGRGELTHASAPDLT